MKAMLRGKLISLSALIKKLERFYNSNLTEHLTALLQKEANTMKRSRWKEISKLRDEINQVETKRTIQRVNKTRSLFFGKINKVDKPQTKQTQGRKTVSKLTKSEMKLET